MFSPKLVKLILAYYRDYALKILTLKINISTLARSGSPKIGSRIDSILNNVSSKFQKDRRKSTYATNILSCVSTDSNIEQLFMI